MNLYKIAPKVAFRLEKSEEEKTNFGLNLKGERRKGVDIAEPEAFRQQLFKLK